MQVSNSLAKVHMVATHVLHTNMNYGAQLKHPAVCGMDVKKQKGDALTSDLHFLDAHRGRLLCFLVGLLKISIQILRTWC